jgi:type II secretory ATPase GspE/PulE/Tfp pilus assembly ATPase PilB-like protein
VPVVDMRIKLGMESVENTVNTCVIIVELLLGSDQMKRMVQQKARTEDMLKTALAEGMTTLVQDGIQKVLQGHTTYKEVKAVAIK